LIWVPIIQKAIFSLIRETEADIPLLFIQPQVSHSFSHFKELSSTVSQIDLGESNGTRVLFVYLSGERLYTADYGTLYVYSMSDHASPIATYQIGDQCFSGIITDSNLYLGGEEKLHVFKVSTSLTQPLISFRVINTKD
jgi:hypothetical protein